MQCPHPAGGALAFQQYLQAPLPANPAVDGFLELVLPVPTTTGASDLCVIATGDTRPTMWVVDAVSLVPAAK